MAKNHESAADAASRPEDLAGIPHPGCLPAWEVGEMPAPVAFQWNWKTFIALVGPGIVMIGGTIGTGEWVTGAGVAALYRGALLWVAPLAILSQVILNTEVMRYTLVTGEPAFTGFLRCRPGPRFWLIGYLMLDCMSWWPALAGLASQILLFIVLGKDPLPDQIRWTSCGLLILCGTLLCFGGKIYNTLEVVLSGKVIFVLLYLAFCTVVFVPVRVWSEIVLGMVNPFNVPPDIQWGLIGAVAGLAGIGGMGNILASNFVREKGWGMGAMVGAIGSAVGGQEIKLSHLGTMARPTEEARRHFDRWWSHVKLDQIGLWFGGSIIGMLLPCLMGAAFLKGNYFQQKGKEAVASVALAQDFGAAITAQFGSTQGQILTLLTLLCGFVILFPGQFSALDGVARRWCDAFWSGSRRVRAMDAGKVRYLYYGFVGIYVTIGCCANALGISAPKMMVINANLANLAITGCILQTLYVNTHFLPEAFRPTKAKQVAMVLAAVFYASIFTLVTKQTIEKAIAGTLF